MCKICTKYKKMKSRNTPYTPTMKELLWFSRNKKFRVKPGSVETVEYFSSGNQEIFRLEEDVEIGYFNSDSLFIKNSSNMKHCFGLKNVVILDKTTIYVRKSANGLGLLHNGFILEVIE